LGSAVSPRIDAIELFYRLVGETTIE